METHREILSEVNEMERRDLARVVSADIADAARMQPAVRFEDGRIFSGPTHFHALAKAGVSFDDVDSYEYSGPSYETGYSTPKWSFLTEQEADRLLRSTRRRGELPVN